MSLDPSNPVDVLYASLSQFMGIKPDQSEGHYITTAIGALEYSCAVARKCGIEKETLHSSLNQVWDRFDAKKEKAATEEEAK